MFRASVYGAKMIKACKSCENRQRLTVCSYDIWCSIRNSRSLTHPMRGGLGTGLQLHESISSGWCIEDCFSWGWNSILTNSHAVVLILTRRWLALSGISYVILQSSHSCWTKSWKPEQSHSRHEVSFFNTIVAAMAPV